MTEALNYTDKPRRVGTRASSIDTMQRYAEPVKESLKALTQKNFTPATEIDVIYSAGKPPKESVFVITASVPSHKNDKLEAFAEKLSSLLAYDSRDTSSIVSVTSGPFHRGKAAFKVTGDPRVILGRIRQKSHLVRIPGEEIQR